MSSIWDIINIPFGYVLRFCNKIVGNHYVFALLLFAVIIEIVLLPFGIKQQKNSIKQARLRPKEMAIRKKYAGRDDNPTKQKMSMEIQELYQKEGYNPMGGCLPLLIQFPIIIALYNIVMNPLKYICRLETATIDQIKTIVSSFTGTNYDTSRNISLLGDMTKMSYSDFSSVEGFSEEAFNNLPNLNMFGGAIDLGANPSITQFNWLLLIPILTFAAYFFSMKMTRKLSYQPQIDDKAMGCSNKMMDLMMPLFSVYIAFMVPAAIGVYWIFKSLLGVVKQLVLKYAMPIPKFTEEDYKAAEKEMNVKAEKAPRNKSGRVVRSLHHIDDEDYDDTAEAARLRREAMEAQEKEEAAQAAEEKKSAIIGSASIKDDGEHERGKKKKQKKTDGNKDGKSRRHKSDKGNQPSNEEKNDTDNTDGE